MGNVKIADYAEIKGRGTPKQLGTEMHDGAFIVHNRSETPYSKDTLGDDFRDMAMRLSYWRDGGSDGTRTRGLWRDRPAL